MITAHSSFTKVFSTLIIVELYIKVTSLSIKTEGKNIIPPKLIHAGSDINHYFKIY